MPLYFFGAACIFCEVLIQMIRQCGQKRKVTVASIIQCFIFSWLLAVLNEFLILPIETRDLSGLVGLSEMSIARVFWVTLLTTVAFSAISYFLNGNFLKWGMAATVLILVIVSLSSSFSWNFLILCILILFWFIIYARFGWDNRPLQVNPAPKSSKVHIVLVTGISCAFFLFMSLWTVSRVLCFRTPTFDFGIFSQMFFYLKTTGLPMTTVERDGLLSHFAVHVSPIYYLMLPFYCIVPTPATLQVLQAAVVISAVIPLWLIARDCGLSATQRVLVCAILMLYPAYSGGTSFDIHENCFLTPAILWLFYGIRRKKIVVTAISAILTLTVKEDAAVYVAVIAVWLIAKTILQSKRVNAWDLTVGTILLVASVCWFFGVTGYLAENGDGVMTWRYQNFMYDGSTSLLAVIQSVILSPMKVLYECMDKEKLQYIALTLGPILGLPLMTRRYERYLLLIPYILVNLMPDYTYQHNVFFQYTFGSTAFLMYLTVLNLSDIKLEKQRYVLLSVAALVSAICFGAVIVPTAIYYPAQAIQNHSEYQDIRAALDSIPDDASVTATTFYTAYLSQRETLYDVRYSSKEHLLETEYVVLSLTAIDDCRKYSTGGEDNGVDNLRNLLECNGYEAYQHIDGVLVIYYRRNDLE